MAFSILGPTFPASSTQFGPSAATRSTQPLPPVKIINIISILQNSHLYSAPFREDWAETFTLISFYARHSNIYSIKEQMSELQKAATYDNFQLSNFTYQQCFSYF